MAESTEQNPSKLKRLKKTNFTVAEEDLIQQLVEKHSGVINGKLTNTVTNQLKKKVWDDIAIKVNTPYRYSRLTRPLELLTSTTITFPLWRQTFCFMTSKFYGNLCDFQQWRTNSDKVYC